MNTRECVEYVDKQGGPGFKIHLDVFPTHELPAKWSWSVWTETASGKGKGFKVAPRARYYDYQDEAAQAGALWVLDFVASDKNKGAEGLTNSIMAVCGKYCPALQDCK